MIRSFTILFLLVLGQYPGWSQKQLRAFIQDARPQLDGLLNDSCWQNVPFTEDFSTSTPVFEQIPKNTTRVQVFFASDALYVGAFCATGKVRADGSARDEYGTGDWFSIGLDTWNDHQNAFLFKITAGGIQSDQRIGGNQTEPNFDAVWKSAVHIQANGWSLEMRIPYTALRFPSKGAQYWGLQMSRYDRSSGELSTWNPQNPLIYDVVLQYGALEGLGEIRQGRRLGLYTYLDVLSRMPLSERNILTDFSQTNIAGLDGRWGLNSNSTLDFSIFPSSRYELRYSGSSNYFGENDPLPQPRQLLAEEGPMFGKSNLFWEKQQLEMKNFSTQVMDPNCPDCRILNVKDPHLLNNLKFTTRTKHRLGIGVYNATFSPAQAERVRADFSETLQKLNKRSNYTLLTAEMPLRNNGWISVSNATLLGGQGVNSNVNGADFRLRDKSNRYEISGNGQLLFWEYLKDSVGWDGHFGLSVAKTNGTWTWRITQNSPTMRNKSSTSPLFSNPETNLAVPLNTTQRTDAQLQYRVFHPNKYWLNFTAFAGFSKDWGFSHTYTLGASVLSKRFYQWSLTSSFNPYRTLSNIRVGSNFLQRILSPTLTADFSITTDNRNPFYVKIGFNEFLHTAGESFYHTLSINPTWVINQHWTIKYTSRLQYNTGYLEVISGPDQLAYYFQGYDLSIGIHQLELNWYKTSKLRLYFQANLFFIDFTNNKALKLLPNGNFTTINLPLITYNDNRGGDAGLGLQYLFAPGSQIRFSYKVLSRQPFGTRISYLDYLERMQASLTIIYFLDPVKKRTFVQHE
jgi:hypothetical protein